MQKGKGTNLNRTWPTDCKHIKGKVRSICHRFDANKNYCQDIVVICLECDAEIKLPSLKHYGIKKPGDEINIIDALKVRRAINHNEDCPDC